MLVYAVMIYLLPGMKLQVHEEVSQDLIPLLDLAYWLHLELSYV